TFHQAESGQTTLSYLPPNQWQLPPFRHLPQLFRDLNHILCGLPNQMQLKVLFDQQLNFVCKKRYFLPLSKILHIDELSKVFLRTLLNMDLLNSEQNQLQNRCVPNSPNPFRNTAVLLRCLLLLEKPPPSPPKERSS